MKPRGLLFAFFVSFAAWALAAPWALAAEAICYEYAGGFTDSYTTGNVTGATSVAAACAAIVADATGATGSWGTMNYTLVSSSTAGEGSCVLQRTQVHSSGTYNLGTVGVTLNREVVECPPSPCASKQGQKKAYWLNVDEPSVPERSDAEGCLMERTKYACYGAEEGNPAYCAATFEYTGGDASEGVDEVEGQQGDCATGPKGTLCVEEDESDADECISFRGEKLCFEPEPMEPMNCISMASGSVVCADDAPVKPDSGVEGVEAVPDVTVTPEGSSTSYHWYSQTTVSNSTTSVVTNSTSNNSTGGTGNGDGDDESLDELDPPELESVGTFGFTTQKFYNDVAGSPLVSAFEGIAAGIPGGACPAWSTSITTSFTSFEVDFTSICDLWDNIAGVLSAVMIAGWAFVAARILMSA